jgi:pyruvate/2-oxoglutarate dehydrogenase complex dihydrolipoamide acyltransferase (E2) component
MFGHRSDGKEIKSLPGIFKIVPVLMPERVDSQVFFTQDIPIAKMDEYINKKRDEEGVNYSYMEIFFAAIVRILAERPQLNRFAMSGRIYARNDIVTSVMIKKGLSDEAEETVVKVHWKGTETLAEVREKLSSLIQENKAEDNENNTDSFVNTLNKIPTGVLIKIVKFLMWLDKHGKLPKFVMELSPFHTSAFLTNVGSIGIDSIYHHIYNFGTTSLFLAMGKKKKTYVYGEDDIQEEKCINMKFVGDERICDGYYYASSFKLLTKYLKKPELLEEPGERKADFK